MLTDVHADTAKFVKISEAKQHDKNFLKHLILPQGSMIAFDKAYNHYLQFAKWTQDGVFFVCRLKYKQNKKQKTLCLRKVTYRDEKGRIYQFITNNWEISNEEVALIYKYRWTIELVFTCALHEVRGKKNEAEFSITFFLFGE